MHQLQADLDGGAIIGEFAVSLTHMEAARPESRKDARIRS